MATVTPFPALRPQPDLAPRICELPYDVMSSDEARRTAGANTLSFLRVSKPEIDLEPSVNPHAPEVYARGRANFQRLLEQRALRPDPRPAFYLYRQVMGRHSQIGLVAAASCAEYLAGAIKKHELTRPDKEDDRSRHIEALNSQTGPAFLCYRAAAMLDRFVAERAATEPDTDFTAADGVRHTSWTIAEPAAIEFIQAEFARVPGLYIADGHHRSAAAARIYQKRHGAGASGSFLAVIFPHNQVQILPYNRVLRDLNGLEPAALLEKLRAGFVLSAGGPAVPEREHEMCLYLRGEWHRLRFPPAVLAAANPVDRLDVTLLQRHVLEPLFGIADPRTSERIQFIGGIRGTGELEKLVDSGEYACAFSMFPTRIEDLMAVADAGGIMPPKSTWFEPKLRDGMFCHML